MPAVAGVLGISLTGQEPPLVQLRRFLEPRQARPILDNFEHLLDATDQLSLLLASAPQIKLLLTSREALNLQEEWLYPGSPYLTQYAFLSETHGYKAVHLASPTCANEGPRRHITTCKEARKSSSTPWIIDGTFVLSCDTGPAAWVFPA